MADALEPTAAFAIRKVVGGYTQSDVNVFIGRVYREIEDQSARLQELREDFRNLSAQKDLALKERRSFGELGGAFEDALPLAEDQSAKMVSDALVEATSIIASANAKARQLVDDAEKRSNSLIAEVTAQTQDMTRRSEQETLRALAEIADLNSTLATSRSQAEFDSADLIASTERATNENLATTLREVEKLKSEAEETLHEAQSFRIKTERELDKHEEDARNEVAELMAQADAYSTRVRAEADAHSESARQSAEEIARDAAIQVESARTRAAQILSEAEARSAEIRGEAQQLAYQISTESSEYVDDFVKNVHGRIKAAGEQIEAMSQLAQNLKSIVNGFDLGEITSSTKTTKYGEVVTAEIVED